jgi:hypothetical protein
VVILIDALSLLIAVAGWHYLFYSRAARRLEKIEDARVNLSRVRLRRVNGGIMLLLAVAFFIGSQAWLQSSAAGFIVVWLAVLALMLAILLLALLDLRLTWKLHLARRRGLDGRTNDR